MTRIETVTIVYQHPKVLFGMKKKGFGAGKYNGFGGGIEKDETLEECAVRETFEEAGIGIINPEKNGEILYQFRNGEQDHLVSFFRVEEFLGTPRESEEIKPEWFHMNAIPYEKMWLDDKYWLPLLLAGKKFKGNFIFDKELKIEHYQLKAVAEL